MQTQSIYKTPNTKSQMRNILRINTKFKMLKVPMFFKNLDFMIGIYLCRRHSFERIW